MMTWITRVKNGIKNLDFLEDMTINKNEWRTRRYRMIVGVDIFSSSLVEGFDRVI